jgi:hypothetical protein
MYLHKMPTDLVFTDRNQPFFTMPTQWNGYVNDNGEYLILDRISRRNRFENGYAYISEEDGDFRKYYLIDANFNKTELPEFDSLGTFHQRVAKAELDGKVGLVDLKGNWVNEPVEKPKGEQTIVDGYVHVVEQRDYRLYYGIKNLDTQEWLFEPQSRFYLGVPSDGLIRYFTGDPNTYSRRTGFFDLNGQIAFELGAPNLRVEDFNFGMAHVKPTHANPYLINRQGERVEYDLPGFPLSNNYDEGILWRFPDGVGLIDRAGGVIYKTKYAGFELTRSEKYFYTHLGGKKGLIDINGNVLVECQFDKIFDPTEGLAIVVEDGKYGVYALGEGLVVEPQYADIRPFDYGVAVFEDSSTRLWGAMDKRGQVILEPRFYSGSNETGELFSMTVEKDNTFFPEFYNSKGEMVWSGEFLVERARP